MCIRIENKVARIAGTETLCGSIASMDECIRIFKKATGMKFLSFQIFQLKRKIWPNMIFVLFFFWFADCSIVFAIEAATLHPATCLGIEKTKGTLNFGADADFVMLDDSLNVRSTWISGNRVYTS